MEEKGKGRVASSGLVPSLSAFSRLLLAKSEGAKKILLTGGDWLIGLKKKCRQNLIPEEREEKEEKGDSPVTVT